MSHYGLNQLARDLEQIVSQASNQNDLLNTAVQPMQKLLSNPAILNKDFVEALIAGHIDGRVYTSESQGFLVKIFAWPPGVETPIHDHNTWGIMGIISNELQITDYTISPGATEGSYYLTKKEPFRAQQGSIVGLTCPHDEIHHVKNTSNQYSLSIHIYGAELVNTHNFDLEKGLILKA